jgi:hypothetical protein
MGGIASYLFGAPMEIGDEEQVSLLNLVNPDHFDRNVNPSVIWQQMLQRLQTHPEEAAAYARSIDASPLYRAMMLAQSRNTTVPVDLVRVFLEAYDEVAFDTPESGESILFLATYGASLDVNHDNNDAIETVKLLMQYNPDAVAQQTRASKMLPLHHVRSDPDIATILLDAYPQGSITKDLAGRLPLHHCCSGNHARQQTNVEQDAQNEPAEDEQNEDSAPPPLSLLHPAVVAQLIMACKQQGLSDGGILSKDCEGKTPLDLLCQEISCELSADHGAEATQESSFRIATLWESLVTMVQTVSDQEKEVVFRMVHAVIELSCSPTIVAHALKLHPQQAAERDSKGCTPLMLAALSLDTVHPGVICTLLKFYPEAACMTDNDGRLPIDIIAESSKYDEELWEALVKAEPRAIDTRDLRDKMFPFMTAAIGDKSNMNNVYRLLRSKPHVLSYFNLE